MRTSFMLLALLAMTLFACSEQTPPPAAQRGEPAATYDVRGIIKQLPANSTAELQIQHEAIADFKSADGSTAPMASMTMDMGVADDLSLEGFNVGDPIAFTLAIWWKPRPAMQVTHLEKLPADTALNLGTGHAGHEH